MDNKKERLKQIIIMSLLNKIKSNYFLKIIFGILPKKKSLEIIKYNKLIQNKMNIRINNYKEFSETYTPIEIEIIPGQNKYGNFINFTQNNIDFFHIYFNNEPEEIKRNYINENDKISKIKIIIDYQIKTFYKLFDSCTCIESINFIKFYRNNIDDMGLMFYTCISLKEINLSNFNTCNVINMNRMFGVCKSLKKINLSNFITHKLKYMAGMLISCESLIEINVSNFDIYNVISMSFMFAKCPSLEKINLFNININRHISMTAMFYNCSNELKKIIKNKYLFITDAAFLL